MTPLIIKKYLNLNTEIIGIICKPNDDILLIVDDLRKKNKDSKELDIFFKEKFYNLGNASSNTIAYLKYIGYYKKK